VIPAANSGASSDRLATVDIASRRPTDVETGDSSAASPAPAKNDAATSPPAASEPVIKPQPAAPKATTTPKSAPAQEPAKPAETPAMPAATAARGNYTLNLSAYASTSGANSLMQKVRALGYPVHSHVIHQGGKALTAVEAGPFPSRTAAESARLKITQSIAGVPARLESGATTPAGDEPAATAAPATAKASRAGGWAVQVAAMSSQSDATALRDKLRANGFDGFVDSVVVGGKKLWRVRAGPQTQRDDALRVREQIHSKLGLSGNVVSVP
jgi:cell division septation protein DedD